MILVLVLCGMLIVPLVGAGRSPHVLYRPSEIAISLDDVVGLGIVKDEVVRTLNLFLAYKTFRDRMGGTPRRAILFEGPPGTGKTYMAKAMAREAGVPFLFVSSSARSSRCTTARPTARSARYFKALRKAARARGRRHRLHRGDRRDRRAPALRAWAASTGRARASPASSTSCSSSCSRSTSRPIGGAAPRLVHRPAQPLPARRAASSASSRPPAANVLVIGATNRAADLDPALLRPGRFDRSIYFDLPGRRGRREIIDYYLDKKAHDPELDRTSAATRWRP